MSYMINKLKMIMNTAELQNCMLSNVGELNTSDNDMHPYSAIESEILNPF